jgi:ketosteroid isomerase-like protein
MLYAQDPDIVIYDALPPLEGFRGFDQMRRMIYPELALIRVRRTSPVAVKVLCEGSVVVTSYQFHLKYCFANGTDHNIDARISEVWERRNGAYLIVHEHPSTTYNVPPSLAAMQTIRSSDPSAR